MRLPVCARCGRQRSKPEVAAAARAAPAARETSRSRLHAGSPGGLPFASRGFALAVTMVLIAATAMLALSSLQTATLAQRMASAEQDRALALRAAEAALADARRDIASLRADGTPCVPGAPGCRPAAERPIEQRSGGPGEALARADCAGGHCVYAFDPDTAPWRRYLAAGCDPAAAVIYGTFTGASPLASVQAAPCYVLEIVHVPGPGADGSYLVRITARGTGAHRGSVVILQQTLVRENA